MLIVPGETGSLSYEAYDFAEDIYPKAYLYDTDGNEITTVNLTHASNGTYIGAYTPDGTYPYIRVSVIVYTTSARTIKNESYPIKPDEIIVKRLYGQAPAGGGVEFGLMPEDLEKLKEWLTKELKAIREEVKKKPEIKLPEVKIPKQSFKPYTDKILDAIGKIVPTDNSPIVGQIKQLRILIDKLPKEIPATQIDLSEIVNLIKELNIPKDNTDQIIQTIKNIPLPDKSKPIDLSPIINRIDKLPIIEQVRALGEIIKNMPNKKELRNILILMDKNNSDRIDVLAKIFNKIIPNLRSEYKRYDQEKEKKIKFKKLLDEVFI